MKATNVAADFLISFDVPEGADRTAPSTFIELDDWDREMTDCDFHLVQLSWN